MPTATGFGRTAAVELALAVDTPTAIVMKSYKYWLELQESSAVCPFISQTSQHGFSTEFRAKQTIAGTRAA